MGKVTGFLEYERLEEGYEPVESRLKGYKEFVIGLDADQAKIQGARCMDCGTPFCNSGCPVNNIIPDFNDLVYRGDWKTAIDVLHQTNNFPEFTGRVCPAPCEAACTLNVNDDAVGIKSIEHAIIDRAWAEGWVQPQPAALKTGKTVAVVGSGPAGRLGGGLWPATGGGGAGAWAAPISGGAWGNPARPMPRVNTLSTAGATRPGPRGDRLARCRRRPAHPLLCSRPPPPPWTPTRRSPPSPPPGWA